MPFLPNILAARLVEHVEVHGESIVKPDLTGHYHGSKSKLQQFKTGVPQGGVLSPVLFNLYTSDIPNPPPGVSLTTYADDMNPAASHSKYKTAEQRLQPYLHDIFNWTKRNDLKLNPDKSTSHLINMNIT